MQLIETIIQAPHGGGPFSTALGKNCRGALHKEEQ